MLLVSKHADHLPLYRRSGIHACKGIDLDRSTLVDWARRPAALPDSLVETLCHDVLSSADLQGDDTPAPVLGACPERWLGLFEQSAGAS